MTQDGTPSGLRSVFERTGVGGLLASSIDRFGRKDESSGACSCHVSFDEETLVLDASDCDGQLATSTACRRTVVDALADRDASRIVVRNTGLEQQYRGSGVELLGSAGRFVERLGDRNDRLATAALGDPLGVADEVDTRVGPVADIGIDAGLTRVARTIDSYEDAFSPTVGLTIGHYRLEPSIDDGARLRDVRSLETGSDARIYTRHGGVPRYMLDVIDLSLTSAERTHLVDGYEAIAEGTVEGDRVASRALEQVTDEPADPLLTDVLSKHTAGYGILEDLFADPRLTDVYVTSPVARNPVRVVVDGESMATNVFLTQDGAQALASRVRRTSGRAFSRANPTVDATAVLENGVGIRVAGVTDPVADGVAFAFRERADDRFTLPGLVANGTMPADVAAFLSVAVERNAAALIAGTRGSGKTTLLGTLLYELTPDTRTVLIEDTPELPVEALQSVGRDVQALRTGSGEGPEITPNEALKTALRLGDGALVVGEIRGEEAQVLYEAMRVGANANAVLGTIHGDGADEVYERVVSDLGVDPSSFGTTDLVVTVQAHRTANGRSRRLARIEEVITDGDGIWFESLYELKGTRAVSTGRIDRGESRVVNQLAGPTETYADVRRAIGERTAQIETLADDGRTSPREVATAGVECRLEDG
ncbi:type II/IV secretion system ATPase subunit [Natronorubrum thiooxidans]|uniref:Type IV secretory pathway ATPase VirB11/Archaellum biosynthesis ATPase n=1 Tax=Natronorubrum thiooxidans TaxID=308853 RepID=A0A1N7FL37_9EURY|nr:type II/IV secretion system ATPase subunit [Natronorubrum thiooxidans]SIS01082.1 Type IV secretory pathway ATPase VirB11/Archaellum biosynthesis ATPase [Natronorubrum thiooxidans]